MPRRSFRRSLRHAAAAFTLVELMAVVAVVAILATIAVPSLQDRVVRAQIVEAVRLADIAKAPIATAWATGRGLPADNAAAGLPAPELIVGNLVAGVMVENGAVHVTFGNQANGAIRGKVLTLRPGVVASAPVVPVAWVCGHAEPPVNMEVLGADRTDVRADFLPLNCRALR